MSDKMIIKNRGQSRVDIVIGEGNARTTLEFQPGESVEITAEQAEGISAAGENNPAVRALFEGDANGPAQLVQAEEQPPVAPPAEKKPQVDEGEKPAEGGAGAPQT